MTVNFVFMRVEVKFNEFITRAEEERANSNLGLKLMIRGQSKRMALEVSEGTGRAVSVLRWSGDEGRSAKAAFQSGFIGMLALRAWECRVV